MLLAVKRHGEASAEEIARELDITPSAVRQHLAGLRAAGYVASRLERGRPGRPTELHHSTDAGDALFSQPSDALLVEVLEHVEAEDPSLIGRIFEQRRTRRVEQFHDLLDQQELGDRVAHLVEALDSEGYLASFEPQDDGSYLMTLHNCAMWPIANRWTEACSTELSWLRDLLPDARVNRVNHRMDGGFTCGYVIRPRV